jgi:hypothetical protein
MRFLKPADESFANVALKSGKGSRGVAILPSPLSHPSLRFLKELRIEEALGPRIQGHQLNDVDQKGRKLPSL